VQRISTVPVPESTQCTARNIITVKINQSRIDTITTAATTETTTTTTTTTNTTTTTTTTDRSVVERISLSHQWTVPAEDICERAGRRNGRCDETELWLADRSIDWSASVSSWRSNPRHTH